MEKGNEQIVLEIKTLKLPNAEYEKHVTLYRDTGAGCRGCILYFHGGGLLYGRREDLPEGHINTLTRAGYLLAAFDYPLAPAARIDRILADVCASISGFQQLKPGWDRLPLFLWGRSAGAYLCLLAAAKGNLPVPNGILSYYGYGLLCDGWFTAPSAYYRRLPAVPATCLDRLPEVCHGDGSLDTHYSAYVYARQTGCWMDLIYEGKPKLFYLNHTLRVCDSLPCPLFCAHSTHDPDVPYEEFLALSERFHPQRFIVPGDTHDFDRDAGSPFTAQLLEATVDFLTKHTSSG